MAGFAQCATEWFGSSEDILLKHFAQTKINSVPQIVQYQEVPDYYTEYSEKTSQDSIQHASTSGVFRFGDAYWGIHARPNDYQYLNSFKESRIDHPSHRYAEKDMIELYPLQLQPGDEADQWVLYTNALRKIPIQYNQSTVLPLPLHLARALEEYCFNV